MGFNEDTHRKLKTLFGGGVGDVLSRNITDAPEEAGADDLGLDWVISKAVLVPLPQPQHHKSRTVNEQDNKMGREGGRETAREATKFRDKNSEFENPCLI